uniref:DAGKc domain-containing protein n=1 Tax=Cucumis melo TaxID=3656 RepID=A0A9I9E5L8_CUCME
DRKPLLKTCCVRPPLKQSWVCPPPFRSLSRIVSSSAAVHSSSQATSSPQATAAEALLRSCAAFQNSGENLWSKTGAKYIVEFTGVFTDKDKVAAHLKRYLGATVVDFLIIVIPTLSFSRFANLYFYLDFNLIYPESDIIPYVETGNYMAYNNEKGGVFGLLDVKPHEFVQKLELVELVAGGDGTVGWAMGSLAELCKQYSNLVLPLGIIPLCSFEFKLESPPLLWVRHLCHHTMVISKS